MELDSPKQSVRRVIGRKEDGAIREGGTKIR